MTSLAYRGPLVALTPEEAAALVPLLSGFLNGTPEYEARRKCETALASDPRFKLPCR